MSDLPPQSDASVENAATPVAADDAEFARAADQISLYLRVQRTAEAVKAAGDMLKRWPDSTTANELAGDAAYAAGKVGEARQHYQRALEIEPANADAERKFGEALLARTPEERRQELISQVIANPKAHLTSPRRPLNAVLNGMLFPGLGQLYNRQQEKGLIILGAAAVTLIILLSILMPYISASLTVSSPNAKDAQIESAQEVLSNTGVTQWLLVAACGLIYLGLYLWGLYDAYKSAQSESEQALGV